MKIAYEKPFAEVFDFCALQPLANSGEGGQGGGFTSASEDVGINPGRPRGADKRDDEW